MGATGLSAGAVGAAGVSCSAGVVAGTAGAAGVVEQSLQTETTEEVAGLTTVHPE
jgi:hypothetical protein